MQQQYELVYIVTPVLSEADLKKNIKKYIDLIKSEKGEVIHEENWGVKQLAYPIQKKTTGYYYLVEFTANTDIVAKLETLFQRDENILRFMITRLDKYAKEYSEKRRKGEIGKKKQKPKADKVEQEA